MDSDSDPRFLYLESNKMPDTIDLCEDVEFYLDEATQILRTATDYPYVQESRKKDKSDESNCSVDVDIEAESENGAAVLSDRSVNDLLPAMDYEYFEIDEESAIAELKVLELKTLSSNDDDDHLRSMSDLVMSKNVSGASHTSLDHLNRLMHKHGDSIKDLADIFPIG